MVMFVAMVGFRGLAVGIRRELLFCAELEGL